MNTPPLQPTDKPLELFQKGLLVCDFFFRKLVVLENVRVCSQLRAVLVYRYNTTLSLVRRLPVLCSITGLPLVMVCESLELVKGPTVVVSSDLFICLMVSLLNPVFPCCCSLFPNFVLHLPVFETYCVLKFFLFKAFCSHRREIIYTLEVMCSWF